MVTEASIVPKAEKASKTEARVVCQVTRKVRHLRLASPLRLLSASCNVEFACGFVVWPVVRASGGKEEVKEEGKSE